MTLGGRQACYRSSSGGVEVRLRVNPNESWIVIRAPGVEPRYREILEDQVAAVVGQFLAIETDPEKFRTFVDAWTN